MAAETSWLPLQVRRRGLDVVHHPGGVIPLVRGPAATVLTIHDLQPLDLPENFSRVKVAYLRAVLPRSARTADVLTTPSVAAADRVAERLGVARRPDPPGAPRPGARGVRARGPRGGGAGPGRLGPGPTVDPVPGHHLPPQEPRRAGGRLRPAGGRPPRRRPGADRGRGPGRGGGPRRGRGQRRRRPDPPHRPGPPGRPRRPALRGGRGGVPVPLRGLRGGGPGGHGPRGAGGGGRRHRPAGGGGRRRRAGRPRRRRGLGRRPGAHPRRPRPRRPRLGDRGRARARTFTNRAGAEALAEAYRAAAGAATG